MPHRLYILILQLLASVAVFALVPFAAQAQPLATRPAKSGFVLRNANSFYRDSDRKLIILQGNVQIIYDGQYMSCDKAVIYEATQEIEAEGRLVISSATVYVEGDRARINYQTGQGVIYNGFVRSGQVVFEGRIVRKIGPEEYEAEAAYYTACTTCPPAWSFTGSRIRATLGGYAYIRNSVLEIAHFPVFWLPYIIVPLKSDRQTGFLIPTLDFSATGGTAISESFFWAISRSQDATFTAKNYSFRGLKGLANYRFLLNESSGGEANFGLIQDRVFSGDPGFRSVPGRPTKFNRWFSTFQNRFDLPEGYVQQSRVNLISDLRYPRDFPEEIEGYGDPALENRFSLYKNSGRTHSSLDVIHYTNLLKFDPASANTDAVHRFPELRHSWTDRPLGESGVLFRLESNYVNFSREDFGYDDIVVRGQTLANGTICEQERCLETERGPGGAASGIGRFDPNVDLIRTGQRLDLRPEVSRPFQLGGMFDLLPVLQFRHTQYAFDVSPNQGSEFSTSAWRQYLRARLTGRMRMQRVYGIDEAQARDVRYRHEVEPELTASTRPWSTQSKHAFFGADNRIPVARQYEPISDTDFRSDRGIQFDYEDRTPAINVITWGLDNRLIEKRWSDETPTYNQVVRLRLTQSYDVNEANKRDHPRFPWSDIAAELTGNLDFIEGSSTARYYPYHNVTSSSSRVRLKSPGGDYFEVLYDQQFRITERLEEDYRGRIENIGFGAGFTRRYLSVSGAIALLPESYTPIVFEPRSWWADILVRPPGDCWSVRAQIRQEIGTEATYKFSFEYLFGGGV